MQDIIPPIVNICRGVVVGDGGALCVCSVGCD